MRIASAESRMVDSIAYLERQAVRAMLASVGIRQESRRRQAAIAAHIDAARYMAATGRQRQAAAAGRQL